MATLISPLVLLINTTLTNPTTLLMINQMMSYAVLHGGFWRFTALWGCWRMLSWMLYSLFCSWDAWINMTWNSWFRLGLLSHHPFPKFCLMSHLLDQMKTILLPPHPRVLLVIITDSTNSIQLIWPSEEVSAWPELKMVDKLLDSFMPFEKTSSPPPSKVHTFQHCCQQN